MNTEESQKTFGQKAQDFLGKTTEVAKESYGWLVVKGAGIAAGTMLLGGFLSKKVDKILHLKETEEGKKPGFFKKCLGFLLKATGYTVAAIGSLFTLGQLPKWLGVEEVDEDGKRVVTAGGVFRAAASKTADGCRSLAENLDKVADRGKNSKVAEGKDNSSSH